MVPSHGKGAIRYGSRPGNTPGTGRPPSQVKAALRKDFDERRHLLREFADGVVRVALLPSCPECGHEGEPLSDEEIAAQLPTVADRIRALKAMAEYSDLNESGLPDDGLLQELAQAVVDAVGGEPWTKIEGVWVDILSRRIG